MKEGWKVVKLGEVCTIKGGSTPMKSNKLFWENGTIPWFTVDDIRDQGRIIRSTRKHITELGARKLFLYPKNTILLCCTASVGEYAIAKIEMTSNQQFNGLMIKDETIIIPEYLFYYSSALKDVLLKLSGKTTIDFVSVSKVSDIEIPLPPLPEQHRIVKILDAAFEKIDAMKANAEKNLENAKVLFQQVLAEELEPKEGWEKKTLGDVCDIRPNRTESFRRLKCNDEVSFLPMEDLGILNKRIVATKVKRVDEVLKSSYTYFEDNDVLLAKVTPCFENGKLGIANNLVNGVGFGSSEFIVFRANDEILNEFLFYQLANPDFRNGGKKVMLGACGLKRLSKDYVNNYAISYPLKNTQHQIVEKLDALSAKCKRMEEVAKKTIEECEALKQSILKQAFNGEL